MKIGKIFSFTLEAFLHLTVRMHCRGPGNYEWTGSGGLMYVVVLIGWWSRVGIDTDEERISLYHCHLCTLTHYPTQLRDYND